MALRVPFPRFGFSLAVACFLPAVIGADPAVRVVPPLVEKVIVATSTQPAEFRYLAFPSLLTRGADEVWISYKAGRSHATDAGSAIEIVQHTLSTGATKLVQRLA